MGNDHATSQKAPGGRSIPRVCRKINRGRFWLQAYQMGFLGVKAVADLAQGKKISKFLDTGVVMVNKSNIDKPEAKNVLY